MGSWTAGTLTSTAQVEGITISGNDVWIVDNKTNKVFKYSAAAGLLLGTVNSSSSFNLNSGNSNAKGIVTDGISIWVIDDSTTDNVFKYSMTGTLLGSWTIDAANSSPTGLTIDPSIDPSKVRNIWTVDSGTKKVYQYNGAASKINGSQPADVTFTLAAGNSNPQGIADPPVSGMETISLVSIDDVVSKVSGYASPPMYSDSVMTALSQPRVETYRVQPIQTKAQIHFASLTKRRSESVGVRDSAKPKLTHVTPTEQNDHRMHDLALLELVNEAVGDLRGHFTARR